VTAEPDPQRLLTALTTEHFTLQGARSLTVSESASRGRASISTSNSLPSGVGSSSSASCARPAAPGVTVIARIRLER
jgi:hypothetical protein